jgi:hypothetical protein
VREPSERVTSDFLMPSISSAYAGPNAPAGLDSNWIPTHGKKPFILIRLYGPKEEIHIKSFRLNDWVRVD